VVVASRKTDGRIRAVAVDGRATYAEGIQLVLGALAPDLEVVAVALTGEDTLDAILEHSPDVVIIGAHVAGADGLQIAATVRSHFPAVRILLLSPYPSTHEAGLAMRIGVHGYLCRDCDVEELTSAIRALVAGEIAIAPPAVDALFSKNGSARLHQDFSQQSEGIGTRKRRRVQ
jgi:DNA-binding NarL/FixJ family response regulator